MSMDFETLNSGSASLGEVRCGQYPLGRVGIGRHFVNEGRTMALTLVNVEDRVLIPLIVISCFCSHNFKCWTYLSVTKEAVDGSSRAHTTI